MCVLSVQVYILLEGGGGKRRGKGDTSKGREKRGERGVSILTRVVECTSRKSCRRVDTRLRKRER